MVKQQTSCMTDNQSAPVKMQVYKVLSVMTSSERDQDMSATETQAQWENNTKTSL